MPIGSLGAVDSSTLLAVRERWFGATGRRVPAIAVEGTIDLDGALVVDSVDDDEALRDAHAEGRPVVARASDAAGVTRALARPEIACVVVVGPRVARPGPAGADVWLTASRPTRSARATSTRGSGAWRRSRSSSRSGRSCRGRSRTIGAIATQAYANPRYGPQGLALLRDGLSAAEAVERLTSADEDRAHRQLGVVDAEGGSATYTGDECNAWAGGRAGTGYAAQGNILVSGETVDALAETFEASAGKHLAERLIDCLDAAEAAGGDSRGRQSAALLVVERDGGYASLSDVLVDLRIDDHPDPLAELRRIYRMHDALFGTTPRDQWLRVDDALRAELDDLLQRVGYPDLASWAGAENLEERVDGEDAVDPVVLDRLRESA